MLREEQAITIVLERAKREKERRVTGKGNQVQIKGNLQQDVVLN